MLGSHGANAANRKGFDLPNTAVEAQACGKPVVAFNIGGLSDIVEHQRTGYLTKAFETEDLAAGIRWVLGHGSHDFCEISR